jgi:VWFA-related protein
MPRLPGSRSVAATAVAAVLAAWPRFVVAQAPAASPASSVVFPAGVEQVTVDVLVLDDKGKPVEGLRREDFTVLENGRPQAVTDFEAIAIGESAPAPGISTRVSDNRRPAPMARSFVIVFDDMNLTPTTVGAARKAVGEFVSKGLRDGDLVQVVASSGGRWLTERMPDGRQAVLDLVERLSGQYRPDTSAARLSDYEAVQIHYARDPGVLSEVLRRWYENGVIQEFSASDAERRQMAELDVSPGAQIVRQRADATYQAYSERMKRTLGTLARVAEALRADRGRKTVLFVSDGFTHDPTQPGFREVVRAARQANAAFYFVDARGLGGGASIAGVPGAGADEGRAALEQDTLSTLTKERQETVGAESVAEDTGGRSIRNTNDLAGQMRAVADESRAYYLLGYVPADTRRDGKFRKIDVQVSRAGLKVRARRGYYAPSDKDPAPPRRDELDRAVRAALDSASDVSSIPLRLTAHGLGPAGGGKSAALVVAEVDLSGLDLRKAGDKWTGALETYTVVSSRETGDSVPDEKAVDIALPEAAYAQFRASGLPIFREFQLFPGAYDVRFVVRDKQSRKVGSVHHEFTVPDPGTLSTSTPILTDRLQASGPQAGARPVPIAHRTFKTGTRLYCAYEVYGAGHDAAGAARLFSSYVVRRPDGSVLTRMEPRPMQASPQGLVSQMLAVSLEGAAPGAYEMILTVRDDVAGRSVEVSEPFDVER